MIKRMATTHAQREQDEKNHAERLKLVDNWLIIIFTAILLVLLVTSTGCTSIKTAQFARCNHVHNTLKQYMNASAGDFVGNCRVIKGA